MVLRYTCISLLPLSSTGGLINTYYTEKNRILLGLTWLIRHYSHSRFVHTEVQLRPLQIIRVITILIFAGSPYNKIIKCGVNFVYMESMQLKCLISKCVRIRYFMLNV